MGFNRSPAERQAMGKGKERKGKKNNGEHRGGPRTKSVKRSQAFGETFLLGKRGLIQAMGVEAIHRRMLQQYALAQSISHAKCKAVC